MAKNLPFNMIRMKVFALLCLAIIGGVSPFGRVQAAKSKPIKGVIKNYRMASDFVRENQIQRARGVLLDNLRIDPTHMPTILLLARIEYRAGHSRRSLVLFKRVDAAKLSSTASFEYGVVAYGQKEWKRAFHMFSKVSKTDELIHFSRYYAAVCLLKLRQFREALSLMRRATQLPSSLRASRRKLIRIAAKVLRREEAGNAPTRRARIQAPPAREFAWGPLPPEPNSSPFQRRKSRRVKNYGPKVGFSVTTTPTVSWEQDSTKKEFSGNGQSRKSKGSLEVSADLVSRYEMKPSKSGDQGYLSLNLNIAEIQLDEKWETDKAASQEEVGTEVNTGNGNNQGSKTMSLFRIGATPLFNLPLSRSVDLNFEGEYQEGWEDHDPAKKAEVIWHATMGISADIEKYSVSSRLHIEEDIDKNQIGVSLLTWSNSMSAQIRSSELGVSLVVGSRTPIIMDELGDGAIELQSSGFLSKKIGIFSSTIRGGLEQITSSDSLGYVSGTSLSRGEILAGVSVDVGGGLRIGGQAGYGVFTDFTSKDAEIGQSEELAQVEGGIATGGVLGVDGTDFSYHVMLSFIPVSWVFFNASYNVKTTFFDLDDSEQSTKFLQSNADYDVSLLVSGGLNYNF